MATKAQHKTTFEVDQVIRPIFTGGSVALDNGARILATTLGPDAMLTDLTTGKLFAQIEGDGEPISTLTLTPSASHLIVCSRSLSMRIYALTVAPDYESVEVTLVRTHKPHATPAVVLAVDRTGTLLATGAADGNIKVWDIRAGAALHTLRGPSVLISALHFFEMAAAESQNKKGKKQRREDDRALTTTTTTTTPRAHLAAGSQDGKVRVWDLTRWAVVANLEAHVSDVQAIDYACDAQTLVTASRDKTLAWWDVTTWTSRRVVPTLELVEAAGFVVDDADEGHGGRLTYTAGSNGNVRLWNSQTGQEVTADQTAHPNEEESIVAALYRPELKLLLCVQLDHTLTLYSLQSYTEPPTKATKLLLPAPQPLRRISGTHDDVIDLAFLLPDQSLLALGTNSNDVRIVSVGEDLSSSPSSSSSSSGPSSTNAYFGQDTALLQGHEDIVITLDVDWSGHWLATGAKDNTARLWRIAPSKEKNDDDDEKEPYSCYAVFAGHAESVSAVALPKTKPSPDTPAFLDPANHPPAFLVTGSQDLTVKRWDIPSSASVSAATNDEDNDNNNNLRALFTRRAHEKDINAMDVDATGQLFASSSQDRTVKIWSTRDGEVQGVLRGHRRGVWAVRFAPAHTPGVLGDSGQAVRATGRKGLVLTGSGDKSVKLWSLADFSCLRTFEGHANSVLKVVWLPGKKDEEEEEEEEEEENDEEMEGQDRQKIVASKHHNGPVLFASGGSDGLVKVWDASLGEAVCTLDNHEDRVWALAVRSPVNNNNATNTTTTLVSGGGDAKITFWRDTTAATALAASQAAQNRVEQEQELVNHMRQAHENDQHSQGSNSNHRQAAISLALQLNQPGRLLAVLSDVRSVQEQADVDAAVAQLQPDQLWLLLLRVRDWNTHARTAPVAQRVLSAVSRAFPAAALAAPGLSQEQQQQSGTAVVARPRQVKAVADALLAYTERHYGRLADLLDDSYLLDYTLQEMDVLQDPEVGGGGGALPSTEDVAMAGAE